MDNVVLSEETNRLLVNQRFSEDFVLPDYGQRNIVNLGSIVGDVFSIEKLRKVSFSEAPIDDYEGVEKIVLFVLDGLGFNLFLSHLKNSNGAFADLAEKGVLKPFTSTFPATTATALTSIFTATTPSEHGIIGFNMFLPNYGLILNTLEMKPVFGYAGEIVEDFSERIDNWPSSMRNEGFKVLTLTRRNLVGSGLSRIIHKNQEMVSYALATDMMTRCRKVLERPGPLFLNVYYGGIDTMEHAYGPYSEETLNEIQIIDGLLKNLLLNKLSAETKNKTLLIVTADHGVAQTDQTYFVKDLETSKHLLLPITGDSRSVFFFPKYHHEEQLESILAKDAQGFKFIRSSDLLENGAFGHPGYVDSIAPVVGTYTGLSNSKSAMFYPFFYDERMRTTRGSHGGMTSEEMLVPLLSSRLSKF